MMHTWHYLLEIIETANFLNYKKAVKKCQYLITYIKLHVNIIKIVTILINLILSAIINVLFKNKY